MPEKNSRPASPAVAARFCHHHVRNRCASAKLSAENLDRAKGFAGEPDHDTLNAAIADDDV